MVDKEPCLCNDFHVMMVKGCLYQLDFDRCYDIANGTTPVKITPRRRDTETCDLLLSDMSSRVLRALSMRQTDQD